jgi:CPSF A subunit region
LRVYDLTHDSLSEVAKFRAPLTALTISTRPPFVLLGDLMKSVTLLRLDTSGGKTEIATVARDYAPLWMTSVAILEEGLFLGAEDSGNIVGWRRDDDVTPDEARLNMVYEMRFGGMVNRIRLGMSKVYYG